MMNRLLFNNHLNMPVDAYFSFLKLLKQGLLYGNADRYPSTDGSMILS